MARVTGIGGVFLRARDPRALAAWYSRTLGIQLNRHTGTTFLWKDEVPRSTGMTAWSIFPADTEYFGPGDNRHDQAPQQAMINYRVDNLDEMIEQLKAEGVSIDPLEEYEYGRFAWITDPEGNRIELWQPLPLAPTAKNK